MNQTILLMHLGEQRNTKIMLTNLMLKKSIQLINKHIKK